MVTFQLWYFPLSFDDPAAVKMHLKVYKDFVLMESIEMYEVESDEKIEEIKELKRLLYEN